MSDDRSASDQAGADEAPGDVALSDEAWGKGAPRTDKPWGHEICWAQTEHYVGKVIVIEAGKRLSLQYHEQKDESILVLSGRLRLYLEDDAGDMTVSELGAGESCRVAVGRRHRFEAVTRTRLIEVSTPETWDVIRVEDDYGREGTSDP